MPRRARFSRSLYAFSKGALRPMIVSVWFCLSALSTLITFRKPILSKLVSLETQQRIESLSFLPSWDVKAWLLSILVLAFIALFFSAYFFYRDSIRDGSEISDLIDRAVHIQARCGERESIEEITKEVALWKQDVDECLQRHSLKARLPHNYLERFNTEQPKLKRPFTAVQMNTDAPSHLRQFQELEHRIYRLHEILRDLNAL